MFLIENETLTEFIKEIRNNLSVQVDVVSNYDIHLKVFISDDCVRKAIAYACDHSYRYVDFFNAQGEPVQID